MSNRVYAKSAKSLLTATCLVCAAAVSAAAPAHAADKIGWLWAYAPTTAGTYTASGAYVYNSTGGAVTVTRKSKGFYEIGMAGLYETGYHNNVQVTAYGTSGYCTSAGWNAHAGSTVKMWVACYSASGAHADTYFDVLFQSRSTNTGSASKGLAFLWDGSPSSSYTPTTFSYNSTGGANTITHNATGSYTVLLPGLTKVGGDVQVTAYNGYDTTANPARCKVEFWGSGSSGTSINVLCFDSTGTAADEEFSLAFSLADPYAVGTPPTNYQAYAWTNNSTDTSVYTPDSIYNYSDFGTGLMTSQNTGTGSYTTAVPPTLPTYSSSNVLVTGYGSDNSYCNVVGWGGGLSEVEAACYAQGGALVNEDFDVSIQAWE
jgi:hypothetical protein